MSKPVAAHLWFHTKSLGEQPGLNLAASRAVTTISHFSNDLYWRKHGGILAQARGGNALANVIDPMTPLSGPVSAVRITA